MLKAGLLYSFVGGLVLCSFLGGVCIFRFFFLGCALFVVDNYGG